MSYNAKSDLKDEDPMDAYISVSLIVARGQNSVIGCKGALPWRLSADLAHFKAVTLDKPIIMGRATWDSLPKKPLPKRPNIVLSRNGQFQTPGARLYTNLTLALHSAKAIARQSGQNEVFIIGGEKLYESALPLADRLYLTEVEASPLGDAYFPDFDEGKWREATATAYKRDAKNDHNFMIRVLHRHE